MRDIKKFEKWANAITIACKKARKDPAIADIFSHNLSGACATASFGFWEKAKISGYNPKFIFGYFDERAKQRKEDEHCWVQIGELIIDPTYSQFDSRFQTAYISNIEDKRYYPQLFEDEALDLVLSWPEGQSPNNFEFIWKKSSCSLYLVEDE